MNRTEYDETNRLLSLTLTREQRIYFIDKLMSESGFDWRFMSDDVFNLYMMQNNGECPIEDTCNKCDDILYKKGYAEGYVDGCNDSNRREG